MPTLVTPFSQADVIEKQKQKETHEKFDLVFGPLLITLQLFGLYFDTQKRPHKKKWTVCRVYATVIMMAIWSSLFRSFLAYQEAVTFGPILFTKLISTTWHFLCSFHILTWHWVCFDSFPEFRRLWTLMYESETLKECSHKCRIFSVSLNLLGLALTSLNISFLVYLSLKTEMMSDNYLPFRTNHSGFIYVQVFILFISSYESGVWLLPIIFNAFLTVTLVERYRKLNYDLKLEIKKSNEEGRVPDLCFYRRKHESITELVECADSNINLQATSLVGCSSIIVCLALYTLITYEPMRQSFVPLFAMCFWIGTGIISVYCVVIGSSRVNDAVSLCCNRNE